MCANIKKASHIHKRRLSIGKKMPNHANINNISTIRNTHIMCMQNGNRKRHVSHKNAPFSPAVGYAGDDDEVNA